MHSYEQFIFSSPSNTKEFHGTNIAEVMKFIKELLAIKTSAGHKAELTKQEIQAIVDYVYAKESHKIYNGVNFSRIQINKIYDQQAAGSPIEFETLGPYLASYIQYGGKMTKENLLPEDAIGLRLATVFRQLFPHARLVSLYDEYNSKIVYKESTSTEEVIFTKRAINNLKSSLKQLLITTKALSKNPVDGKDFLFIPESEKASDAEILVQKLEKKGYIIRKEHGISFFNPNAENQLYRTIPLRTKNGRWLCEALDAATFLKRENLRITHIVVLPEYMKTQQDKMWEILKVLGIKPDKYHNIFFDESRSPEEIAKIVEDEFNHVQQRLLQKY